MDKIRNPYAPGAGAPPPELAGRDAVIEEVTSAVARVRIQRPAQSAILIGLRGVGKTVLLQHLANRLTADGNIVIKIEAPENKRLTEVLAPALKEALIRLDLTTGAADKLKKASAAVRNFLSTLNIEYGDLKLSVKPSDDVRVAESGLLESDMIGLFEAVAEAAAEKRTSVVLCIDEMQYVPLDELGAIIAALHNCAQTTLPFLMIGAGLPLLRGGVGKAKSYAERLFKFHQIGPLDEAAAEKAIVLPAQKESVSFETAAVAEIIRQTHGYPYFLQEWGDKAWSVATASPITLTDVNAATQMAQIHLDQSFFGVRFDRCTPIERMYMRAMAELIDEHLPEARTGDIAALLQREPSQMAPHRSALIKKGMIYSPSHGSTAFTVPLIASYLRRQIPVIDMPARKLLTV